MYDIRIEVEGLDIEPIIYENIDEDQVVVIYRKFEEMINRIPEELQNECKSSKLSR